MHTQSRKINKPFVRTTERQTVSYPVNKPAALQHRDDTKDTPTEKKEKCGKNEKRKKKHQANVMYTYILNTM